MERGAAVPVHRLTPLRGTETLQVIEGPTEALPALRTQAEATLEALHHLASRGTAQHEPWVALELAGLAAWEVDVEPFDVERAVCSAVEEINGRFDCGSFSDLMEELVRLLHQGGQDA